ISQMYARGPRCPDDGCVFGLRLPDRVGFVVRAPFVGPVSKSPRIFSNAARRSSGSLTDATALSACFTKSLYALGIRHLLTKHGLTVNPPGSLRVAPGHADRIVTEHRALQLSLVPASSIKPAKV